VMPKPTCCPRCITQRWAIEKKRTRERAGAGGALQRLVPWQTAQMAHLQHQEETPRRATLLASPQAALKQHRAASLPAGKGSMGQVITGSLLQQILSRGCSKFSGELQRRLSLNQCGAARRDQ
jgi:hypothetical protein